MTLDLNCDLGENEPAACTRALMRSISSANIACGGHAGSVDRMEACVTWALAAGVRLGAHPGARDPGGSGRDPIAIAPPELQILLLHQVGALDRIARAHHTRLHHVKLHGALYHASDTHQDLAEAYVTTIARWWPRLRIYARRGPWLPGAPAHTRYPSGKRFSWTGPIGTTARLCLGRSQAP